MPADYTVEYEEPRRKRPNIKTTITAVIIIAIAIAITVITLFKTGIFSINTKTNDDAPPSTATTETIPSEKIPSETIPSETTPNLSDRDREIIAAIVNEILAEQKSESTSDFDDLSDTEYTKISPVIDNGIMRGTGPNEFGRNKLVKTNTFVRIVSAIAVNREEVPYFAGVEIQTLKTNDGQEVITYQCAIDFLQGFDVSYVPDIPEDINPQSTITRFQLAELILPLVIEK